MPSKNSNNQRTGKAKTITKKPKKNNQQQNNNNSSNEFYSAVLKSPNVSSKQKSSKTETSSLSSSEETLHNIPYASVQSTSPFPAGDGYQRKKSKGLLRTITTMINRVLTVFVLIIATYYVLRGCDATKTENGECTAIMDPIKQDIGYLLEHDMYKSHVEPYTNTMRAWYDHWQTSEQGQKLQTIALDRVTAALDRAKILNSNTLELVKIIVGQLDYYLNQLPKKKKEQSPTTSNEHVYDEADYYYSATMTPYETQLPHKEIQGILATATKARTQLDGHLRYIQGQLSKRLGKRKHRESIRTVAEEIKSDMEHLRKNAENQVMQRVKEARKTVDDETELTAIRQAERTAFVEVHKSDLLMDEIRLEIDQHVEIIMMKKWSTRQANKR
ncbi:hypothetical protein BDA99DRAFT_518544 [Phascolomyces articulosus]|uniref:Uncharacterized protein n=1 Tax=Phascolomyces articulosus TaxID=60185 RepID=A0AAD5JU24_9FUNG|nr:hypothetical protein BDA99DRAFT_518544 [Phascolomyces articulosus]